MVIFHVYSCLKLDIKSDLTEKCCCLQQSVPLATAAVWSGGSQAAHWAAEGAWGRAAQGQGFWEDAIASNNKKVGKKYVLNKSYFSLLTVIDWVMFLWPDVFEIVYHPLSPTCDPPVYFGHL